MGMGLRGRTRLAGALLGILGLSFVGGGYPLWGQSMDSSAQLTPAAIKSALLAAFPLSAEAREFLENLPIRVMGFSPGHANSLGPLKGIELGTAEVSTVLHEFSHAAWDYFIDPELQKIANYEFTDAIIEWAQDPEPGYEHLVPYLKHFIQDGSTWHLAASLPQFVGGNIRLMPPKLRKWFPWLGAGEVGSWEEARALYQAANHLQRMLMSDLYTRQWGLLGEAPDYQPGPGLSSEPAAFEGVRVGWIIDLAHYDLNKMRLKAMWAERNPAFWKEYVARMEMYREILGDAPRGNQTGRGLCKVIQIDENVASPSGPVSCRIWCQDGKVGPCLAPKGGMLCKTPLGAEVSCSATVRPDPPATSCPSGHPDRMICCRMNPTACQPQGPVSPAPDPHPPGGGVGSGPGDPARAATPSRRF